MDSFPFEKAVFLESLLEKARKVQSQRSWELATNDTQETNNIQDSLLDHLSSAMVNHQLSQTTEACVDDNLVVGAGKALDQLLIDFKDTEFAFTVENDLTDHSSCEIIRNGKNAWLGQPHKHTNLMFPKSQQLSCRIHSSHKNCQPRQLTNGSKTDTESHECHGTVFGLLWSWFTVH